MKDQTKEQLREILSKTEDVLATKIGQTYDVMRKITENTSALDNMKGMIAGTDLEEAAALVANIKGLLGLIKTVDALRMEVYRQSEQVPVLQ